MLTIQHRATMRIVDKYLVVAGHTTKSDSPIFLFLGKNILRSDDLHTPANWKELAV